jgi:GT2 family glycosyltransferase
VTFWEQFLRLLPWRPWQALAALYWQMTRRKVRARNRLREAVQTLPFAYDLWISTVERNSELASNIPMIMDSWAWRPTFSIMLHSTSDYTKDQVDRSVKSVRQQLYPCWTLVDHAADLLNTAIASADADYIVPLRIGDALSEVALFRFAESLQNDQSAVLLYGDQDQLDETGRRTRPWFKPRWNEEMFLAQDFLSSAVAIEKIRAEQVIEADGDPAQINLSKLLLAITATADGSIVHIPHILCHIDASTVPAPQPERLGAVAKHIRPLGAECVGGPFGTVKVNWPLPAQLPLVSVIVPTRDRVELLAACLDGLLQKTNYRPFEVLVVDNGSSEPRTLHYLAQIAEHPDVRVLRHDRAYNFSAINNLAAREARGSFLCLLNNDTEVVEPDWLNELMRYAVRPEVGAVGAKLLYDDGSIQHAGVVVGLGDAAGHAHRFTPAEEPGYFRQPHVAQFVTAVTAACLVVDRAKFDAVGGLDEEGLAIAFNDVDLCLKLQTAGLRNVYVPHAVLLHHESKSRGSDLSPKHLDRYLRELRVLQERWGPATYEDPLHNPNLDRYSETYLLRL